MEKFNVRCVQRNYPVYIGHGLLRDSTLITSLVAGSKVLIVTNDVVGSYYLPRLQSACAELSFHVVVLPDGEAHKTQSSVDLIYDHLVQNHHHRDTTLIALGGGVIGDMTGYAASTYQRGVRFIQIPTTLLAQVDASIGGKTAINHARAKNMIGTFYQPSGVIIDTSFLSTLPEREFKAGFAEIIKYALLKGGVIIDELKQILSMPGFPQNISHHPLMSSLIMQCCQYKAAIVEADEEEHGSRALLNLGHTFGHALEAYTRYERWLHGEAVAIGLYCAALLSYHLGYLTKRDVEVVDTLLNMSDLPCRIPQDVDLDDLYSLLFHDKKVLNNCLRFVLIKSLGECFVDSSVQDHQVKRVLKEAQGHLSEV